MNQQLLSQVMASCVNEPDWLMKKRQLAVLLQERFKSTPAAEKIMTAWRENPRLAQLNQATGEQINADQSQTATQNTVGCVNLPLFAAANAYPELLQENLMEKAISWQDSQLNAMHLALLNGGRFIYIPDGTIVKEPIELTVDCPLPNYHNLVIVGAGAQATIVEHQIATGRQPACFGTELLLGDGARVDYYQSNRFSAERNHQAVRAYQAQHSVLNMYLALFDEHDLTTDFYANLDGQGGEAEIKMVTIASGQQIQGVQTQILNHGPHTVGNIVQNGVAKDKAVLNFHAVGKTERGAYGANSQQQSRILTLSDECKGEADPVLLIEENDVNAGHAASIGKVDADDLYYLESRGLSEHEAQVLLTRGFLLPVLNQFPDQKLREQLINELEQRLEA
ncbi:SufB/SufD family protein [Limosilactobacillus pulli]|uniref:SufB/SufD family protein n=1 Tax=Limosilactobacillus pulli TaxID=2991833 RepID=UPI0024BBBA2A|nr:SufD family Fe-S cluster assembly protein [Limosilactobacillus pulli]